MNHENYKKVDYTKQIYTCPMHPEVKRDKPGMCPECGMNLVPASAEVFDPEVSDRRATVGKNIAITLFFRYYGCNDGFCSKIYSNGKPLDF